jgi:uncharacterized protein (TIGR02266 family)
MTADLEGDSPPTRAPHRLPVELPVTFTVAGGPPQAGRVANVTRAGLFIATATPLAVGTAVELLLALPGDDGPRHVRARAEVRWVNEGQPPRAATLPPGMGLEFVWLEPAGRELLAAFLAARLAALRGGAQPGAAWVRPVPRPRP